MVAPPPSVVMVRTLVSLFAICLPVAFEAAATGQEAAAPAAAQPAPEPSGPGPAPVVSELSPELYYLRDDSGRLVPVPGFRYQDFLELFRIKEGLGGPAEPPAAIIESAVVEIDARGLTAETASCPTRVTLRVRQSRAGWAMVPLGLGQVLLSGPPEHDGPGRMLVDADPEGGGYRVWFEPPRDAGDDLQHVVTLSGSVPVVTGGARESFALRMPVAVASRVELRTARDEPRVELRPPDAGRVETQAVDGGRVVIITGLSGDVGIRLEEPGNLNAAERATEADCESVVRIDGRVALISATLALANLAPGTRQVRITLPKQARLRRVGGDGALLDAAARAETVTVGVEPAADGSAVIELVCERPVDPNGTATIDPLGFAVAGVEPWLQRGRTSLFIVGEWQVTWEDMTGIRRVDAPANEREAGLVAAFAYDAQPASLPLAIRPRRSRVVVEPEYRYVVATSRVTLDARLRVAVRGAPVGGISLALDSSWVLGDVGPAGVVDAAGVRSEAGRVTIPFLQPLAGDAVVEIEAAREVNPRDERLAWRLPAPKADLVGPATVVVSSATDIELLPDSAGIAGLVRQTSSSRAANDDAIALAYRLDAPEGTFAATRRFLPRRVEAVLTGRITADERQIEVAEAIRLDVLHVPLEFLELSMAQEVLDSGTLEIRQGSELLEALDIVATTATDSVGRPLVLVRALLPTPLLGRGEVTVAYRLPIPAIPAESTAAVDLPLPVPVASGTIRQSVAIAESPALAIMPRGESWRRDVSGQPSAGRTWSASQPRQVLPLAISARTREAVGVTVIEAAWLRTRLFPDAREDTATYVVVPAEPQLELRLPLAATSSVEARLDGSPVSVQARGDGRIMIDTGPPAPGGRLLELRATSPWGGTFAGLGLPWPLRLDPPTFDPDVLERRFSWEVAVLPGDHLWGIPARWTGQQRWAWRGLGWARRATVSSAELADWVAQTLGRPAVTVAAPAWAPEAHRAVYVGIGPPGSATAWVVPTWSIVLVASGLALAAGLGMLARSAWRSAPVVIGTLACGTLLTAAFPDTVPLVAQAAAPGVALAALAAALAWLGRPAAQRRSASVSGPASSLTRAASPTVSLIVGSSVERGSQATFGRDAS